MMTNISGLMGRSLGFGHLVKAGALPARKYGQQLSTVTSERPPISPTKIPMRFLDLASADKLVEHVVGVASAPVVWTSVTVSGQRIALPLLSDLSVSQLPKSTDDALLLLSQATLCRDANASVVQAQIQFLSRDALFPIAVLEKLLEEKQDIWRQVASDAIPNMAKRGGGIRGFHVDPVVTSDAGNAMAIVTLNVDVCDAMGANCLNTVAEAVSEAMMPDLPDSIQMGMRILTNSCVLRRVSFTLDLPKSSEMAALKNNWEAACEGMTEAERLYSFAKGMTDVTKVTANDSRAVLAALTYDVYAGQKAPFEIVETTTGFQIRIDAPAPFGSVGRLARFPFAVDALEKMAVKKASDIAFHAALSGVVHTLAWLKDIDVSDQTASESSMRSSASESHRLPSELGMPSLPKLRELNMSARREALRQVLGGDADFGAIDPNPRASESDISFPVGVLPNLVLNGRLMHLLAATEEPSVVAGTCFGIKLLSHDLRASVRKTDAGFDVGLHTKIPVSALSRGEGYPGDTVRDAVVAGCRFANACPERATTNNKGFDNGMSAAAMAMGWDEVRMSLSMHQSCTKETQKVAPRQSCYGAIVNWTVAADGDLEGHCRFSIPAESFQRTPHFSSAAIAEKLLDMSLEDQISAVVSTGMAVHLASLIALGTKGIQANHMGFHTR
jgi:hydroxymethylglutaryl-CoA reductase